jgi:5'-deoxynucleotidase YfbR-like HD superfamily hydrolase
MTYKRTNKTKKKIETLFSFIDSNNFYDLADSDRWQGFRLLKKDNTAEHTHYVTLFVLFICRALGLSAEDTIKVLQYAILHDFDETYSGDVRHPFKYNPFNGPQVRAAIDAYTNHRLTSLKSGLFNDVLKEIPKLHDNPKFHKIVKLGDWMSMYYWLDRERKCGNKFVVPHLKYCVSSIVSLGLDFESLFGIDNQISKDIKQQQIQNRLWQLQQQPSAPRN